MKQIAIISILFVSVATAIVLAQELKEPEVVTLRLADVTVAAQPTGKRHQSYVFTLKSTKNDSTWTFELYQDFGGSLMLFVAGNRHEVTHDGAELLSHYQKGTTLRLQKTKPQKTITGETVTHKFLSLTWGEQEPNL